MTFEQQAGGLGHGLDGGNRSGGWAIPLDKLATAQMQADFEAEWDAYLGTLCTRSTHTPLVVNQLKAACWRAFIAGYTLGNVR